MPNLVHESLIKNSLRSSTQSRAKSQCAFGKMARAPGEMGRPTNRRPHYLWRSRSGTNYIEKRRTDTARRWAGFGQLLEIEIYNKIYFLENFVSFWPKNKCNSVNTIWLVGCGKLGDVPYFSVRTGDQFFLRFSSFAALAGLLSVLQWKCFEYLCIWILFVFTHLR